MINKMTMDKKKMAVTILAAILLIMLYGIIFDFSSQNAQESTTVSIGVSQKCVNTINVLTMRGWTQERIAEYAEKLDFPIRKLAHFSEYAYMGMLVYIMLSQWMDTKQKRFLAFVILWVFLSASFDEIHQLFSPGRSGNLKDVCLDTCGGFFGFLVFKKVKKFLVKNTDRESRS